MGDKAIVEFRAGRLYLKEGKLVPSTTKGLVRAFVQEDGLVQFEWNLRAEGPDQALIELILPGEAEYKRLEGAPGGRVFCLSLNASGGKHFFWMQELASAAAKDEEYLTGIQSLLSAAPVEQELPMPVQMPPQSGLPTDDSPIPTAETPMSLASPFVPAPAAAPESGRIRLEHLQNALVNLPAAQQGVMQETAGGAAGGMAPGLTAGLELEAVLDGEALVPLIYGMTEADLERFKDMLPEGHTTLADVADLVASPQFQQAVEQLNGALHSRELPSIWMQCDLKWDPAKLQGSVVECFVRAMAVLAKEEAARREA